MRAVSDAATRMAIRVEKAGNRRAVRKATTPMLKESKRLVPVRTGELKRSLVSRVQTEGRAIMAKIGGRKGTRGGRYLHLVEFGSVYASPQPFLRPAFEATKDESKRIYQETVWADIKAEAAKAKASASR